MAGEQKACALSLRAEERFQHFVEESGLSLLPADNWNLNRISTKRWGRTLALEAPCFASSQGTTILFEAKEVSVLNIARAFGKLGLDKSLLKRVCPINGGFMMSFADSPEGDAAHDEVLALPNGLEVCFGEMWGYESNAHFLPFTSATFDKPEGSTDVFINLALLYQVDVTEFSTVGLALNSADTREGTLVSLLSNDTTEGARKQRALENENEEDLGNTLEQALEFWGVRLLSFKLVYVWNNGQRVHTSHGVLRVDTLENLPQPLFVRGIWLRWHTEAQLLDPSCTLHLESIGESREVLPLLQQKEWAGRGLASSTKARLKKSQIHAAKLFGVGTAERLISESELQSRRVALTLPAVLDWLASDFIEPGLEAMRLAFQGVRDQVNIAPLPRHVEAVSERLGALKSPLMHSPSEEELMRLDCLLYQLHSCAEEDPLAQRLLEAASLMHSSRPEGPFLGFRFSKFWSEQHLSKAVNRGFSPLELLLAAALFRGLPDDVYSPLPMLVKAEGALLGGATEEEEKADFEALYNKREFVSEVKAEGAKEAEEEEGGDSALLKGELKAMRWKSRRRVFYSLIGTLATVLGCFLVASIMGVQSAASVRTASTTMLRYSALSGAGQVRHMMDQLRTGLQLLGNTAHWQQSNASLPQDRAALTQVLWRLEGVLPEVKGWEAFYVAPDGTTLVGMQVQQSGYRWGCAGVAAGGASCAYSSPQRVSLEQLQGGCLLARNVSSLPPPSGSLSSDCAFSAPAQPWFAAVATGSNPFYSSGVQPSVSSGGQPSQGITLSAPVFSLDNSSVIGVVMLRALDVEMGAILSKLVTQDMCPGIGEYDCGAYVMDQQGRLVSASFPSLGGSGQLQTMQSLAASNAASGLYTWQLTELADTLLADSANLTSAALSAEPAGFTMPGYYIMQAGTFVPGSVGSVGGGGLRLFAFARATSLFTALSDSANGNVLLVAVVGSISVLASVVFGRLHEMRREASIREHHQTALKKHTDRIQKEKAAAAARLASQREAQSSKSPSAKGAVGAFKSSHNLWAKGTRSINKSIQKVAEEQRAKKREEVRLAELQLTEGFSPDEVTFVGNSMCAAPGLQNQLALQASKAPVARPYLPACDFHEQHFKPPKGFGEPPRSDGRDLLQLLLSAVMLAGVYLMWSENIALNVSRLLDRSSAVTLDFVETQVMRQLEPASYATAYCQLLLEGGLLPLSAAPTAAQQASISRFFTALPAVFPTLISLGAQQSDGQSWRWAPVGGYQQGINSAALLEPWFLDAPAAGPWLALPTVPAATGALTLRNTLRFAPSPAAHGAGGVLWADTGAAALLTTMYAVPLVGLDAGLTLFQSPSGVLLGSNVIDIRNSVTSCVDVANRLQDVPALAIDLRYTSDQLGPRFFDVTLQQDVLSPNAEIRKQRIRAVAVGQSGGSVRALMYISVKSFNAEVQLGLSLAFAAVTGLIMLLLLGVYSLSVLSQVVESESSFVMKQSYDRQSAFREANEQIIKQAFLHTLGEKGYELGLVNLVLDQREQEEQDKINAIGATAASLAPAAAPSPKAAVEKKRKKKKGRGKRLWGSLRRMASGRSLEGQGEEKQEAPGLELAPVVTAAAAAAAAGEEKQEMPPGQGAEKEGNLFQRLTSSLASQLFTMDLQTEALSLKEGERAAGAAAVDSLGRLLSSAGEKRAAMTFGRNCIRKATGGYDLSRLFDLERRGLWAQRRRYLVQGSGQYKAVVYLVVALHMLLCMFEAPTLRALDAQELRVAIAGSRGFMFFWEGLCITLGCLDMGLLLSIHSGSEVFRPMTVAHMSALGLMLLDFLYRLLINSYNLGCIDRGVPELLLAPDCFTNAMPYTAVLRVMPLLYHNSKLRTSFKSTFVSIVKAREIMVLLTVVISITTALGMCLYYNYDSVPVVFGTIKSGVRVDSNVFRTMGQGLLAMFIYLLPSTDNFSDIAELGKEESLNFGFFSVVCSVGGMYIIMALFIGVFQTAYDAEYMKAGEDEREAVDFGSCAAFYLLDKKKTGLLSVATAKEFFNVVCVTGTTFVIDHPRGEAREMLEAPVLNISDFKYLVLRLSRFFFKGGERSSNMKDPKYFKDAADIAPILRSVFEHPIYNQATLLLIMLQMYLLSQYGVFDTALVDTLLLLALIAHIIERGLHIFAFSWSGYWNAPYDVFLEMQHRFDLAVVTIATFIFLVSRYFAPAASGFTFLPGHDPFRLCLAFTTLRILSVIKSFRTIILGLMYTLPTHSVLFLQVIVVLYVYSIVGVILFAGGFKLDVNYSMPDVNFDSFNLAVMSLLQMLVGAGWSAVMQTALSAPSTYRIYIVFFISYMLLVSIVYANLVVGVIINSYYVMTNAVSEQGGRPLSTFDLTDAMSSAGVVAKDALVVDLKTNKVTITPLGLKQSLPVPPAVPLTTKCITEAALLSGGKSLGGSCCL